jgi:hypothetical protein
MVLLTAGAGARAVPSAPSESFFFAQGRGRVIVLISSKPGMRLFEPDSPGGAARSRSVLAHRDMTMVQRNGSVCQQRTSRAI